MKATIFVLLLFSFTAYAQTSAFTYQGRFNDSGAAQPTNGQYDFRFDLVDFANSPVGPTQFASGLQVTGGVFTVQLDFGSDPFTSGANRYLVIAVKRPADPAYVTLAPRQQLTSSPFATQALNAENLGGRPANEYINVDDKRLTDARDPLPDSPNYIRNSIAGQTADFKITGTGTILGTAFANLFDTAGEYRLNGSRILDMDGAGNLFVGQNTLVNTGLNNAFIGVNAGTANTSGGGNTFVGNAAGSANSTGFFNSFYGHFAGNANAGGSDNSFFGVEAGRLSTASQNSFFGRQSGLSTTTGGSNSFFGYRSGWSNTIGASNSFFGNSAGSTNEDGTNNTFVGTNSGSQNRSGGNNTFIGKGAGVSNSDGSNNTIIGADANVPLNLTLTFATAIGAGSLALDSNVVALGRPNGADTVLAYGKIRFNTLGAAGSTQLCRNASSEIASCSSSLRYKSHVSDFTSGLSTLLRLRPITFDWKDTGIRDLGFGAEDIVRIEPLLVTQNDRGEVEGVKYDRITTVLVNAVKEQQEQIEAQSREIAELKAVVCSLRPKAQVCGRDR
jgi:hypothetical protein